MRSSGRPSVGDRSSSFRPDAFQPNALRPMGPSSWARCMRVLCDTDFDRDREEWSVVRVAVEFGSSRQLAAAQSSCSGTSGRNAS
ncbi:MAG: hypothetical protein RL721_508 [Candidatus Eisenbacteria bacterium]